MSRRLHRTFDVPHRIRADASGQSNAMRKRVKYPGGPAHACLLIGLNCYDILKNQTEQDLKVVWWKWAEREPEAFQKAWLLVQKSFTDGKGVLYRIRHSISLEWFQLYVIPKGSGIPVLCRGGQLYQARAGYLCSVTHDV